jgi:Ca2+-binding RTX toxin-like protein
VDFGGPGAVRYVGGSVAMTVTAGGADVTAVAGSGAEGFVVSAGSMAVSYAQTPATGVSFSVVSNILTGTRGALGDRLVGVGTVTLTGRNDVFDLSGFVGFNPVISALNAGGGDDQLAMNQTGTGVVDTGSGNDTVAGRMGDGSLTLGGGNDRVDMAVLGSGVQIKPLVVSGGAGGDNITIVTTRALLTVTGDAGDDKIDLSDTLEFGNYTVDGGEGSDTITTLSGLASVLGGLGDDTLTVTAMNFADLVSGGEGNDTLVVSALAGFAQGDDGNDNITFHLLISGAGTAVLDGGSGDDVLTVTGEFAFGSSFPGNQAVLRGGEGDDTLVDQTPLTDLNEAFVFTKFAFTSGWGDDTVTGFTDGDDLIRFEATAGAGLDDFADLTITGDATQTLITFGLDTILLDGLDVALFSAADVEFV